MIFLKISYEVVFIDSSLLIFDREQLSVLKMFQYICPSCRSFITVASLSCIFSITLILFLVGVPLHLIILQVFHSLLKAHALEARAVVRQALEILTPAMPGRMEDGNVCRFCLGL